MLVVVVVVGIVVVVVVVVVVLAHYLAQSSRWSPHRLQSLEWKNTPRKKKKHYGSGTCGYHG